MLTDRPDLGDRETEYGEGKATPLIVKDSSVIHPCDACELSAAQLISTKAVKGK